jgi:hypothetical protein
MRILGPNTKNELVIEDAPSNSTITYYWRNPTDAERIRYSNELYTREKNKADKEVIMMHPEVRRDYGLKVLTGFKYGDFGDENGKPISSDETHGNYRKDWKELILANAPEHLPLIAMHVFESTKIKSRKVTEGIEIEVAQEGDERPFQKN